LDENVRFRLSAIFTKILFSLYAKISSHFREIFVKMLILEVKSIVCVVFKTFISISREIFIY